MLTQKSIVFTVDLNAKNVDGYTAFHFARGYGNSEISEMLIQKSVDLNIDLNTKNEAGCTAFHYACSNVMNAISS